MDQRIEKKYLVYPEMVTSFIKYFSSYLPMDSYSRRDGVRYTSVYFEDALFSCLQAHRRRDPIRFKLRLRMYTNLLEEMPKKVWLEKKKKWGKVSAKDRLVLTSFPKTSLSDFLNWAKSLTIHQKDRFFSSSSSFQPVILIHYLRRSWVSQDKTLRVTLDQNILNQPLTSQIALPKTHSFENKMLPSKNAAILEIKIKKEAQAPFWAKQLVVAFHLPRLQFSKYERSMRALMASKRVALKR